MTNKITVIGGTIGDKHRRGDDEKRIWWSSVCEIDGNPNINHVTFDLRDVPRGDYGPEGFDINDGAFVKPFMLHYEDEWHGLIWIVWDNYGGVFCRPGCQRYEPLAKTIDRMRAIIDKEPTDLERRDGTGSWGFGAPFWQEKAKLYLVAFERFAEGLPEVNEPAEASQV